MGRAPNSYTLRTLENMMFCKTSRTRLGFDKHIHNLRNAGTRELLFAKWLVNNIEIMTRQTPCPRTKYRVGENPTPGNVYSILSQLQSSQSAYYNCRIRFGVCSVQAYLPGDPVAAQTHGGATQLRLVTLRSSASSLEASLSGREVTGVSGTKCTACVN